MPRLKQEDIEEIRKTASPLGTKWSDVRRYRDYYRGRQRGTLNADQVRILAAVLGNKFSDNLLRKIVNEHANRLRPARYDVEDNVAKDFLYMEWIKNQLPSLFSQVFVSTLRDANSAVMLSWQADARDDEWGGYVGIYRERWWDGTEGVFVAYDDYGRPEFAVKEWSTRDRLLRRTVYYPGEIQRLVRREGGWVSYVLPEDEGISRDGIVPWMKRNGDALGIPVVHFPNGSDDDTHYGASILSGGPLAFQDQINAIQHDMTAAAMLNGSPQTWSKGFELPLSDTGERIMPRTGPGAHHHTPEDTAAWGNLEPGSLAELRSAYETKRAALCLVTDTPLHTITGVWPSGEAIFRAEMATTQAARTRAEVLGPRGASMAHRATEIYNAYGTGPEIDETSPISLLFEPPEQPDEMTRWDVAAKASNYVSDREVLRLAGYSPDRIEEIMDEKEAEARVAVEAQMAAFDRGPALLPGAA